MERLFLKLQLDRTPKANPGMVVIGVIGVATIYFFSNWIDSKTNGQTDALANKLMDQWTDGLIDGQMDRQLDRQMDRK